MLNFPAKFFPKEVKFYPSIFRLNDESSKITLWLYKNLEK